MLNDGSMEGMAGWYIPIGRVPRGPLPCELEFKSVEEKSLLGVKIVFTGKDSQHLSIHECVRTYPDYIHAFLAFWSIYPCDISSSIYPPFRQYTHTDTRSFRGIRRVLAPPPFSSLACDTQLSSVQDVYFHLSDQPCFSPVQSQTIVCWTSWQSFLSSLRYAPFP